jgi:hypothetical protein
LLLRLRTNWLGQNVQVGLHVAMSVAVRVITYACFFTLSMTLYSIFGEPGEKAGLLSRSIEYLFDMVGRYEAKAKVRISYHLLTLSPDTCSFTYERLIGEVGSHTRRQLPRDLLRPCPRPCARVSDDL